MKKITIIWLTVACVGCTPFPIKEYPDLELNIADENGNPISDAKIHFAKRSLGIGGEPNVKFEKYSDNNGNIHIKGRNNWKIVVLAPDGVSLNDWGWCIEKQGYTPEILNNIRGKELNNPIRIVMKKNDQKIKCSWSKRYFFSKQNNQEL